MRTILTLGVLVAVGGCSESVHVNVHCVTEKGPTIVCELNQVEGKSEVDVCWDFSVTCENGGVVAAPHTCHKVKDGGKASVTIGADHITGFEGCDGTKPPTPKLENLTINGKPSTK